MTAWLAWCCVASKLSLLARFCNLFGCSSSGQPYLWNYSSSRPSASMGFLRSGNQTYPHLSLIRRKQPPCAAYAHTESFLGRDSATSRGGRLFATQGQAALSDFAETCVLGDSCGGPYISLRLSPAVPHGATLPPILDKSASIMTISPPKWASGAMYMYKALQSVAGSVIARPIPPSSFTVRNSISCAVFSVVTRSSKTTQ